MVAVGQKELNYKAYLAPGSTRVNTELPQSNPLIRAQEPVRNPDDGLVIAGSVKKVWGQPTV